MRIENHLCLLYQGIVANLAPSPAGKSRRFGLLLCKTLFVACKMILKFQNLSCSYFTSLCFSLSEGVWAWRSGLWQCTVFVGREPQGFVPQSALSEGVGTIQRGLWVWNQMSPHSATRMSLTTLMQTTFSPCHFWRVVRICDYLSWFSPGDQSLSALAEIWNRIVNFSVCLYCVINIIYFGDFMGYIVVLIIVYLKVSETCLW